MTQEVLSFHVISFTGTVPIDKAETAQESNTK